MTVRTRPKLKAGVLGAYIGTAVWGWSGLVSGLLIGFVTPMGLCSVLFAVYVLRLPRNGSDECPEPPEDAE